MYLVVMLVLIFLLIFLMLFVFACDMFPQRPSRESLLIFSPTIYLIAFVFQGVVWVLELEKIPKSRPSTELKRKKEFVEVSPVKKCGKVMGQSLILTEPDGLSTTISLKGCIVEAVSSSRSSSKKW